jgi:endoglucanase
MKTFLRALFLAVAIVAYVANAKPTSPEQMSGKTALQFWADKGIKIGWNLGNTLDAHNNGVGTEGVWSWGGPTPPEASQALFNGVKASGFDIVRIPVTWTGHIGSSPDYTVSETRLQRVAEVIDYAKTAGIKAMIINIHHDGLYMEKDETKTTLGFLNFPKAENDANEKNKIQEELGKVWTQIANYFKNYGDYLIFETMNEVHNGNWGVVANTQAYRNQQDILFDWNQAALNAIRATGGNNATRFVAVPGLGSTEPSYVINAHNRQKLLPSDGANGTDKLIVSVHYYHPAAYTVSENLKHTLTQTERNHPASAMSSLKSNFINNGIAVYVGEWGAPTDIRATMSDDIKATHREYIRNVANAIVANGIVPLYFDDGGYFKMLERSNGQAQPGLWEDVLSDMMSAKEDASPTLHSQLSTLNSKSATYYTIKGEPLGNAKPQKAGVYIFKQGNSVRKIAVR